MRQGPNPQLRKGDGEDPTDTRGLSLLTVWHAAWAKARYGHRAMEQYREGWTPAGMYGARKGCTINDVSAPTQLLLEVARMMGVPAAAIALDKDK